MANDGYSSAVKYGVILSLALLWASFHAGVAAENPGEGNEPLDEGPVAGPDIRFTLSSVQAEPGQIVDVPFGIVADRPLSMVSWTVEFDPEALVFAQACLRPEVLQMLEDRPATESLLEWDVDSEGGWFQASFVADFLGRESFSIPPGLLASMAVLKFWVPFETPPGGYPVSFTRPETADFEGHFRGEKGPVYNAARGHGRVFSREERFHDSQEPELEDGVIVVSLIGDVGIFRGDANLDQVVDISDPMRILKMLFLERTPIACPEAADANEDGDIDVSDPVIILLYLFTGTTDWCPTEIDMSPGCVP